MSTTAAGDDQPDVVPGAASDLSRLASLNLNLLVPLLALVEEASVTRAAERVGLTQPAMSRVLVQARRLVGDEILVRQGTGMVLTPHAAQLAEPLRRLLQDTAALVDFPVFDPATSERVVTMAMTSSTAFVVAPTISRLLAERAPGITFRLRNVVVPPDSLFTEDHVDVVLLAETFPVPLPRERLYANRWVVVAHPDAPADASGLDLLTSLPHVVLEAGPSRVLPYRVLDAQGVPYRVRQTVADYLLIPHVVAQTGGVAVHGATIAGALQRHFDLRVEEFPFPVSPGLDLDMIWNPRLADEPFVAWLRELLRDAARIAVGPAATA